MLDTLKEAQFWGFNSYGDWFDMLDCADIPSTKRQFDLADALWFQKKANFHSAQRIGLPRSFLLTPNHVYLNQASQKDIQAVMGGHVFGQLVCPSNPKGREIILKDYEYLFADAKAAGIRFTSMESGPYDYGGCNCEKCKPWILTYAKLAHDIHKTAEKYHPGIKNDMIGWWWKPEEHRLFAEWCDKNAPGWVRNMYLHIPYGKTTVSNVPLPKGCKRGAFVHIGYADKAQPKDVYGHWGPVVAADRLEKTLIDLKKQGVTVLTAYSEGQSDDVNKALYAGLGSGKYKTADEVLEAYAARYFGTDVETSKKWAAWIKAWGSPFDRDTKKAKAELAALLPNTPNKDCWRCRQWVLKADLLDLHRQIMVGKEWTPERLALVDQFWQTREKIHRGLWGLGPQRHIFARPWCGAPWYGSWAKHVGAQRRKLIDVEQ